MAHTHPVVDSDSRFVINSTTRVISTTSDKLELIQGDHQSERITFEIPKIVEGHDMSLCDRIEIHYINIDKRTSATSRDVYIADDVAIDGDKLTFSWLISGNATKYYGRLNFIILFECLDPDGNYTYKWNTEICKLLTIGEGISNTSAVIEDHSDILEKFRNEILEEAGEKSIKPDWNQNDSTAKDYVKNRPFYTGDSVETVLVEESTASFADTGEGFYIANFPSTFEATVGETYKVYWDGTTYECTCVNFDDTLVIGNLSILGAGSSDTGEPFVMNVKNGQGIIIATADTSASHTFSISGFAQEVVKIDEKYLPDTVATKSEVETAQAIANNAQTTANNARIAADSAQTTAETARATANKARTTAETAQTTAKRAQTTANKAVKPSKQLEDGCSYFMYNPYSDYKSTNVLIGTSGGTSLTIEVNKEQCPSVAFVPPVYDSNQADFEFRRATAKCPHPLITGIGGIVVYSSTPKSTKKFKITVDDSGTIRATEVM